jgi:hypothetical protein
MKSLSRWERIRDDYHADCSVRLTLMYLSRATLAALPATIARPRFDPAKVSGGSSTSALAASTARTWRATRMI